MYNTGFKSLATAIMAFSSLASAHATDTVEDKDDYHIALGLGILTEDTPFNSAGTRDIPIPIISLKQGAFDIETAEAGVHLNNNIGDVPPIIDLFLAARSPSCEDREMLTADADLRLSLGTGFISKF